MKKTIFFYTIFIFLIILIAIIFALIYRNQIVEFFKKDKIQKDEFQSTSIISNNETPTGSTVINSKPSEEITTWFTYKSEEGKIELSYPAEWPIISDQASTIPEEKRDFPFSLILGNSKEGILISKSEDRTRVLISMTNLLDFDFGHHTVGPEVEDSKITIDGFPADKKKYLSSDGKLIEIDVLVNVKDKRYLFEIGAETNLDHKEQLFNRMLEKIKFL